MILIFVIVPAIAFVLSRHLGRCIFRAAWGLFALSCVSMLILELASENKWPLNPEWMFGAALVSSIFAMSTFIGWGIWKVTTPKTGP